MSRPALLVLLLALVLPAQARTVEGQVVKVIDGDSLIALVGGRELEIRLDEIDAPERNQPYGRQARELLTRLALDRKVRIDLRTRDAYGREVAWLQAGETAINARLVELGGAWAYRRYLRDRDLLVLEDTARRAGRGLWALPERERVPPWEWRQALRRPQAPQAAAPARPDTRPAPVVGNRRSGIYHLPHCPSYADVSPGNRVPFATSREAEAAGYRRARNCPS